MEKTDYEKEREEARKAGAKATKAQNEKAETELVEYKRQDRQEMEDARTYKPQVAIKDYPTGAFFCVDDREWPLRYVESIEVGDKGRPPETRYLMYSGRHAYEADRASIKVTMHSGQEHYISCNRFQLDPLLDAMRTVWKEGRSTQ